MKGMNISLKALLGISGLLALCAVAPAHAVAISDSVDPNDTLIMFGSTPAPCPSGFTCSPNALSFVMDIKDHGFNVGLDTLNSATIAIHLMDTGGSEGYRIDVGTGPQTFASVNVPGGNGSTDTITLNAASIADLAADGKINVTVSSTHGGFSFADALLTTQVTEFIRRVNIVPDGTVPEPSTLLLLGAGLIALGSRLRRRG